MLVTFETMTLSYEKLNDSEIQNLLSQVAGWSIEDGHLIRAFEFDHYFDGIEFARSVGVIAEDLNHHPDIFIGYRKATIKTMTHDANGLTTYDFALASKINGIGV